MVRRLTCLATTGHLLPRQCATARARPLSPSPSSPTTWARTLRPTSRIRRSSRRVPSWSGTYLPNLEQRRAISTDEPLSLPLVKPSTPPSPTRRAPRHAGRLVVGTAPRPFYLPLSPRLPGVSSTRRIAMSSSPRITTDPLTIQAHPSSPLPFLLDSQNREKSYLVGS